MNADRMRRIQELFASALKRPAEERAAFLREAGGDDVELRTQVESLLEDDQLAGDHFMKVPETRSRPHSADARSCQGDASGR